MRSIRLIIEVSVAVLVSFVLLETVLHLIDAKTMEKSVVVDSHDSKTTSIKVNIKDRLSCIDQTPLMQQDKCFNNKIEHAKEVEPEIITVQDEESEFIAFIYLFIMALSSAQMVLMMESFFSKKISFIERYKFAISDYSMKVTPMLGITGTLFSISQFASQSESVSSVITLFKENISDAIGTTIFAVIVYALNSFWHMIIASRGGENEN